MTQIRKPKQEEKPVAGTTVPVNVLERIVEKKLGVDIATLVREYHENNFVEEIASFIGPESERDNAPTIGMLVKKMLDGYTRNEIEKLNEMNSRDFLNRVNAYLGISSRGTRKRVSTEDVAQWLAAPNTGTSATLKEIAEGLGISTSTARKHVFALHDKGRVACEKEGKTIFCRFLG